jgi:predicted nuclease with TOPRIM domain
MTLLELALSALGSGGLVQVANVLARHRERQSATAITAQVSDADTTIRTKRADADAERALRDELRTELASSKAEAKIAREESHRLNRENAMLSARLESTNARLAHLEQQNTELLETVETLRREFANAFRDGRESRVEPTVPALPRPRTKTNQ